MTNHWIGSSLPRPDVYDKVSGRSRYIHDLKLPGMLYGKIKFSSRPHARILHIDTSRAEKLPGVKAVITAENTPEIRIGFLQDNVVLKRDKVRQYRDEVAAVAATDPEIAAQAVELIRVEYEDLVPVFSTEEALAPGAPLIHETDPKGRPRTDNLLPLPWTFAHGDVQRARDESAHWVEDRFSTKPQAHASLGTTGCLAVFDLRNNLTIHAKTQIPYLAQKEFRQALEKMGLKDKNVRVLVPELGGSFGSGLDTHAYEFIAILLAHAASRPVRIVMTREEEFACLSPRQPTQTTISQGCDRDGRLTFRKIEMTLDNGAYTSWGATTPSVMMLPISSLYRVPNIWYQTRIVYTNNTYAQAMRGYGNPQATWALESNLDQLAEKASMDPAELRMINRNHPGETTPMGLKITSCGFGECLEKVESALDWRRKRGQGRNRSRGVGMASLFHTGGGARVYRSDATGVILKIDDFGGVQVLTGGIEMGQGLVGALQLVTAEALGVTPEKVNIVFGDTSTCPWDVGTHASRGIFTAGNAVILAADQAREKIFRLAATHFASRVTSNLKKLKAAGKDFQEPHCRPGYDPSEFELRANTIFLKESPDDPLLRVRLDEILRQAHFKEQGSMVVSEAFYDPENEMSDLKSGRGNISTAYIFGAHGLEVEVDRDTGQVRILDYVAAHDVGRVLNRPALEGQFYGGIAQGLGFAMTEEVKSDQGRITNPNFLDYKIPSAADLDFPIELECIETNDQAGPFGAKGVGEPGLVPVAAALANAIYDAVGVRLKDLPITPEKILAGLKELKEYSSEKRGLE
ncbi:MAG: xanthine dehydrogenase family protein molybdopterin-binding subunit [Desulfohalobiaceae bacterium]|nr:xanthine dehydrogenase family protein molybdopterin-binding subunit [Desulfohalobiaceae bacterium]